MILELKGIPNPKQAEFFRSTARHTAYGGAAASASALWTCSRTSSFIRISWTR